MKPSIGRRTAVDAAVILFEAVVQVTVCPMPHAAAELAPDRLRIGVVAVRRDPVSCPPSRGTLSAKTDDGGFTIDPADLSTVFEPTQADQWTGASRSGGPFRFGGCQSAFKFGSDANLLLKSSGWAHEAQQIDFGAAKHGDVPFVASARI